VSYRVIQCYTGLVGSAAIRLAGHDPRVDIVGVFVHHEDKEGRDIGDLAGVSPMGITATRDLDGLLAAGADCAIWAGARDDEAVARILRAGVNVYALSGPFYAPDPGIDFLQGACEEGGVTFFGGGNIPGLISEVVPLFLSGYTGRVTQVRAWQRNHVPNQPSAENLTAGCGFGRPIDSSDESVKLLGRRWGSAIRQSAELVADGLGLTLDDFELSRAEYAPSTDDLYLPASGVTIARGTAAGVRWQFTGYSNGASFYQMNVEMTVALALGPGWRVDVGTPNWRIEIDGTPSLVTEITLPDPEGSAILLLNAARAINSVSRLVEAPVGFRTILDFPAPTGSAEQRTRLNPHALTSATANKRGDHEA
jgi:hypothetical protein